MKNIDALQARWRCEDELTALGVEVTGAGIDHDGDWEIVVVDPHQRRGPQVSLFSEAEVEQFKERLHAR